MKNNKVKKYSPGLVSIIIPVYNGEDYLSRCIRSVFEQTYKDYEVLLINDGSTDKSGNICSEFSSKDDRIRVIHSKNNGPAAARNLGIKKAAGAYIFFLDADDFIEKNCLQLLINKYNKSQADLIIGGFNKIQNGNSTTNNIGVFKKDKLLSKQDIIDYTRCYLRKPNRFPLFAYSWGRLFKSSLINNNNLLFNSNLHTFEDVAFNFDYLNYTNKICFLKTPVYNHVIHSNYSSATLTISDNPKKLFGYKQALTNIDNFLQNGDFNADIHREVGHAYICLTIIQLVRTCGQINNTNKKLIYELVHELINDLTTRTNLAFYSPTKGDSKILPLLMKLKLSWAVMSVCKYKANKRYKKGPVIK